MKWFITLYPTKCLKSEVVLTSKMCQLPMTWLTNVTKMSNLSIFSPKRKKLKTWRKFGSGNTITFSVECQHRDISRLSFASTKTPHRKKSILKVISRRSQLLVFIAVCKLLSWECHNYNSFRINCNFSPRSEDLKAQYGP